MRMAYIFDTNIFIRSKNENAELGTKQYDVQ